MPGWRAGLSRPAAGRLRSCRTIPSTAGTITISPCCPRDRGDRPVHRRPRDGRCRARLGLHRGENASSVRGGRTRYRDRSSPRTMPGRLPSTRSWGSSRWGRLEADAVGPDPAHAGDTAGAVATGHITDIRAWCTDSRFSCAGLDGFDHLGPDFVLVVDAAQVLGGPANQFGAVLGIGVPGATGNEAFNGFHLSCSFVADGR